MMCIAAPTPRRVREYLRAILTYVIRNSYESKSFSLSNPQVARLAIRRTRRDATRRGRRHPKNIDTGREGAGCLVDSG